MPVELAYRLTLVIPIALTLVLIGMGAMAGDHLETIGPLGELLSDAALWLAAASPLGILYVIFAAFAWSWGRTASSSALRLALNIAPILFLALVVLGWGLVVVAAGSRGEAWSGLRTLTIFVLIFGYACVGLGHLCVAALRWKGLIEPAA